MVRCFCQSAGKEMFCEKPDGAAYQGKCLEKGGVCPEILQMEKELPACFGFGQKYGKKTGCCGIWWYVIMMCK